MRSYRLAPLVAALVLGSIFASSQVNADQQFEASVTLMEAQPPGSTSKIDERRVNDLAVLAASATVKQRTVETLYRLSIAAQPEKIVTSLTATAKPGTDVLVIRVVASVPEEAEAAANVAASEFIKMYDEMAFGSAKDYREKTGKKPPPSPAMQIVDEARSAPVVPPPVISASVLIGVVSFVFGVTVGVLLTSFKGSRKHD